MLQSLSFQALASDTTAYMSIDLEANQEMTLYKKIRYGSQSQQQTYSSMTAP